MSQQVQDDHFGTGAGTYGALRPDHYEVMVEMKAETSERKYLISVPRSFLDAAPTPWHHDTNQPTAEAGHERDVEVTLSINPADADDDPGALVVAQTSGTTATIGRVKARRLVAADGR